MNHIECSNGTTSDVGVSVASNGVHPNKNKTSSRNTGETVGFYYLSSDARQNLLRYQYKGADLSLMYQYILSPLAAFCVTHWTPKTMAPNTITLSGLSLMILSYAIYCYYVPSLEIDYEDQENYPPRWIFLLNGMSMLIYQTLDNMDGKQARRTNSSSPLGLLFDHGCDAVNSMFGSANWMVGMGLVPRHDPLLCWAVLFGPFAMFYIATWEEYYTGELILPLVNGPNEGLFLGAMLSVTSYLYGFLYWQGTTWHDTIVLPLVETVLLPNHSEMASMVLSSMPLRNCDFVVLAATIGFAQEILMKSWNVARTYGIRALLDLLPLVVLGGCFLVIGKIQPQIWWTMPRTSLLLASILFSEMCTELMLCHITAQAFDPFARWHLLPLVALTMAVVFGGFDDGSIGGGVHEAATVVGLSAFQSFLLCYTASLGTWFVMKIVTVIHEACAVLNIWCFDIVTKREQRQGE
jgi:ethanolaminephosphotransferase